MTDVSVAGLHSFRASPAIDRDGLFAFILFVPMLFMAEAGTYGAVIVVLATAVWAAMRRHSLPALLRSRWYVLLFPGFVIASTLWSVSPAETLKHSLEFSITVLAALLLASSRNPRSILFGLFAAFLLYSVVSLAFGNKVDVGNYGAQALSGLGESKNEAADMAGTGFVISVFLALTALQTRRWLQSVLFAVMAALQGYLALKALSSGATAAMIAGLAVLVLLLALRKATPIARTALLSAAAAGALAFAILFEISGSSILHWLASLFGKDPTLTGRTYLWLRARDLVAEHPFLGRGFGAFWQQGNLDAEGLWQFAKITTREGFNFHNTLYDTLVNLGWAGAVVLGLTFVLALGRVARDYVATHTIYSCFWLGMAVYLFIRMPTECVGLIEFYFSTVLLFACLGSAKPVRFGAARRQSALPPFGGARAEDVSATARFAAP